MRAPASSAARPDRRRRWMLAATLLAAANLRVAITSVPPLLGAIRHSLDLGLVEASFLTTLPVLGFGLMAPLAAPAARRLGLGRALLLSLAALAAGLAVRVGPDATTLFVGTALASAGMAAGNVLMPAIVKESFAAATGWMTGLYTTAMARAGAVAAGASEPLAQAASGLGWRAGLGVWSLLAAAALLVWRAAGPGGTEPPPGPDPVAMWGRVARDPVAAALTLFMGLQSASYYAVLTWLPTVAQADGLGARVGGLLLTLASVVGMPFGLALPAWSQRLPAQALPAAAVSLCTAVGLAGLALAPGAGLVVWTVLFGVGQGASFPLALTLIGLRTRTSADTAAVSAFVQALGYAMAALGPVLVALLREATGSWTAPILVLAATAAVQAAFGARAGRPGFVRTEGQGAQG
jgi:CP family cyanate transporter-like MFS transporter